MSSVPDMLVLRRHRDLEGRAWQIWVRRSILWLIGLVALLGLLNVFGQRPYGVSVDSGTAKLTVYAPDRIRGGDFMEGRFHITAHRDIKDAVLVLDPGWLEGLNINTIEPSPANQTSADGRLSLSLGPIKAGAQYILFLQFQVNATNLAWNRPQNVQLYDGTKPLLSIDRSFTVFP